MFTPTRRSIHVHLHTNPTRERGSYLHNGANNTNESFPSPAFGVRVQSEFAFHPNFKTTERTQSSSKFQNNRANPNRFRSSIETCAPIVDTISNSNIKHRDRS